MTEPNHLAQRMQRLGTETAFEVLARAKALEREGKDMVHVEVGEPDFETPPNVVEAAAQALRDGMTHYGPAAGLLEAREAIAEDFSQRRGVDVSPDQVVVLAGAKPAIFFTLIACLEEGDEAIYPNPGFPIYQSMIEFSGAKAVPLPLREENQFRMDVDELESLLTPRTRLVIINSPQNPTGSVLEQEDVRRIAQLTAERGILLFSDEIYSRILYDGDHHTPWKDGDPSNMVVLDGFSKIFSMTGWRLGYSVSSVEWATKIARLQTNCNSCPATFSQIAGIEALRGPQEPMDLMVEEFRKRRQVVVDGLNDIPGVTCIVPRGAFYAFANIRETGRTSRQLQDELLEQAGVAALAGTSFGEHGEGYLRLSYANSVPNLEKALDRMRNHLAG